ncbi:MAG: class I SAM-dependent methyltransferase [Bacteroidia bacterium]|nr:class I SAM-dependent methyltransferase [Bacteroidia bacterium]
MEKQILRHDKQCRICGSSSITTVLKLKDTPLEDQFVRQSQKNIPQPVYPLELAICEDCGYVHLPYIVSPEVSYTDYVYVSSVTVGLRNHFDVYAEEIVSAYAFPNNSLIVDLGSNDGSMLASFKRLGLRVVGVEPAKAIATQATASGLPTINDFFTNEVASQIVQDFGQANVITANYMYANIDDVLGFTKAVSKLLAANGIFVVQTGYHPEQMKIKMFDYIYHEHFSYFTVEVLKNIFSSNGLELIHAAKTSPKGGSVRIVGQLKNGPRPIDSSVDELIHEEHTNNMRSVMTYLSYANEINKAKKELIDLLQTLKASGKRIVGFGASHSTTTLIYNFELEAFMEYLVDDNKLKQGKYSPGYHLPVYSIEKLYEDKPDYLLILAWQHGGSIMQRHKAFLSLGGKFLIPLPNLKVINDD